MDSITREKIGIRAMIFSVSGKILLTIFNFVVGILSGSTALVVESAHTLSDILTSSLAYIGFKVGLKPPDQDHPYGHGRAEPLIGLAIGIFLLIVVYEIFSQVYSKLILGAALTPPAPLAAVMALIGIGANYALTSYSMNIGKKVNSPAIISDAKHQKVDVYACAAIFIGVVGARMGFPILDPIVAFFIGLLVLKTAFEVFKDNVNNIMGKLPSEELLKDIKSVATSIEGVYGAHDIKINYMGPYASAELHVEVDCDMPLKEAHEMAHKVENAITKKVGVVTLAIVHVCPLGVNDEDLNNEISKEEDQSK
jgi:cation diffusion facilitator family transporter